jgi:hypothetical protein
VKCAQSFSRETREEETAQRVEAREPFGLGFMAATINAKDQEDP